MDQCRWLLPPLPCCALPRHGRCSLRDAGRVLAAAPTRGGGVPAGAAGAAAAGQGSRRLRRWRCYSHRQGRCGGCCYCRHAPAQCAAAVCAGQHPVDNRCEPAHSPRWVRVLPVPNAVTLHPPLCVCAASVSAFHHVSPHTAAGSRIPAAHSHNPAGADRRRYLPDIVCLRHVCTVCMCVETK